MPAYPFPDDAQAREDIARFVLETGQQRLRPRYIVPSPNMLDEVVFGAAPNRAEGEALGRDVFTAKGCNSCHDSGDEAVQPRPVGPTLELIGEKRLDALPEEAGDYIKLYGYFVDHLADPASVGNDLMPRFSLTDAQREAIAVALLAETTQPAEQYVHSWQPVDVAFADEDAYSARYWTMPIPAQGAGPAELSLLERDPSPESCRTCHREQYHEWRGSRHAKAMSPGVTGQLIDWIADDPGNYYSCMRCHARLVEQLHVVPEGLPVGGMGMDEYRSARGLKWEHNPHFRAGMYEAAHGCANCHKRAHTRYSRETEPPEVVWDDETLSAHELVREPWLESSEYCKDCHQFPESMRIADGHPPLQNTYEEWRAWNETAGEPQTCQQCHMPEHGHGFKGIHDRGYVAENVTITSSHERRGGVMHAAITLKNTGNGHHLPTYVTPKIYLHGYFRDADGKQVEGTFQDAVVGREAHTRAKEGDGREWYDEYDTRIPAGEGFTFEYEGEVPAQAASFHLEIFVAPDDFYHKNYRKWVGQTSRRSPQAIGLLNQALAETEPFESGYYLLKEEYAVD
jgi:mono/diheme cytochrome c family protein